MNTFFRIDVIMLFLFWVACTIIAMLIGDSKGRSGQGFCLGLFLGILGVIIIACLPPAVQQINRSLPLPPPQPGWYPDPNKEAVYRFYNGFQWTDQISNGV